MAINNLKNTHLSEDKVAKVKSHITGLETELAELNTNLTAEERRKLGSINEQNKLFVNRDYDFYKNQPTLKAPQVDWEEFERDYKSREVLTQFIDRLETLLQNLKNARILHDHDNYQDALVDYAYTNFMAGTSAAGYEQKQKELAQFFADRGRRKATPPTEQPQ